MNIPKNFYKSEILDGFYVPAIMKRLWASTLEVLSDIAKICEKHSIKWWLDYGNMLGIIRHEAFIPWDDDVDISMTRKDYNRFVEIIKTELPEEYKVTSIYLDDDARYFTLAVCNGGGHDSYAEFLKKFHGFPYQSVVDIFVYDDIDVDSDKESNTCIELIRLIDVLLEFESKDLIYDHPEKVRTIEEIAEKYQWEFNYDKPIRCQILRLCDMLMQPGINSSECKEMACKAYIGNNDYQLKVFKENYNYFITRKISGYSRFPIPVFYSDSLYKQYGDYVRPVRGLSDHDYPHYEDNKYKLKDKMGGLLWEDYDFQIEDITYRNTVKVNDNQSKDVVFLITKAANWVFMEKEYNVYKGDDNYNIFIIPIPYYDKNYQNQFDELHLEADGFPDYIQITKPDEYDFYGRRPEIVYYDDPYDNYDAFTSVFPFFYSDNIRKFSRKMIYVSCILVDEYNQFDICAKKMMQHCILVPGVTRADEVIVQSENMKQRYIEALTEWAGEDTKTVWENKIKGTGVNRKDIKEYPDIKYEELSSEWIDVLYKQDGTRKEVVLYYTSISELAQYGRLAIKKMEEIFNNYRVNRDAILYFHPDPDINEFLQGYDEELWISFSALVNRFIEDDYGIYDDGDDLYFMICLCDRFIGDRGKASYQCIRAEKPVEILQY